MTSNNSRSLLIVLVLISTVLLAVLILGVYNVRLENTKTSELLNTVDRATELEILTQSIEAVRNNAKEDLEVFNNIILSSDKLVPLIESIEGTGRVLGLDIKIVSVDKIENLKSSESGMVRIVMETQGSWASTLSFLRAVESLPHRVIIDDVGISRNDVDWHSRIILSLYSSD